MHIENFLTNIGPHLLKLLSNIKGLGFFGTRCIREQLASICHYRHYIKTALHAAASKFRTLG